MKRFYFLFLLLSIQLFFTYAQEKADFYNNQTPEYKDIIKAYQSLDNQYSIAKLIELGQTDIGKPLHLFIINADKDFNPQNIQKRNKSILFINNGIHPGESCGIDASIQFSKDLLSGKLNQNQILKNTVICIIPVYNIGGCLNRNSTSRQNQNGPEEHGYRGNAKNLDLNRDFIKCDSKNAKSLVAAFHEWNPDVYIDTHSSNGADYQYVLTLVATHSDKMNGKMASFMNMDMLPYMFKYMKKNEYEMTPYVQTMNWSMPPDSGIVSFFDIARYATGFASLFNTYSFFTETHMLKPYKDRVLSTYHFINGMSKFISKNSERIKDSRLNANKETANQNTFTLKWELNTDKKVKLNFKGYTAKYKKSNVTGLSRLYYDRNAPYENKLDYFPHYKPVKVVRKPRYYIIPQAFDDVIERLSLNKIKLKRLAKDTLLEIEVYIIEDYSTNDAYEGHYLHSKVKVKSEKQRIQFYKGDYVVETNQAGNKYILEVLEPESGDSFFAWNFFDGVLQRKEWFSAYIFEETAAKILKEQPKIKKALDEAIKKNPKLAQSDYGQLTFIHKNAIKYNKMYNRYPVYRCDRVLDFLVD